MRIVIHDFIICVGGNRAGKNYLTEEHAYSEQQAINRAQELSRLYPASNVFVEHWILQQSKNFLVSGLYKGEVFNVRQAIAA